MRKFAGPNESVLSYKCAGRMSSPDFGAHGMRIARHRPRNAGWCLANRSIRDGQGKSHLRSRHSVVIAELRELRQTSSAPQEFALRHSPRD